MVRVFYRAFVAAIVRAHLGSVQFESVMDVETLIPTITAVIASVDTSDSSSDEDDRLGLLIMNHTLRGPQIAKPRTQLYVENVVSRYDDQEFKTHFRMNRTTFQIILRLVAPLIIIQSTEENMGRGRGRLTKDPQTQLLVAIWTFATPDSYRSVCDRFDIARATAMRIVRRVTRALNLLTPDLIKWPSRNRIAEISAEFLKKKRFPNVLGPIDGTHIKIAAPAVNPEAYVNRKGFHSIQLQVVCDSRMLFIHAYTGQVGSVHDMRVFRLSGLEEFYNEEKFPGGSHLIGDAAYALHKHMMVPFKDNGHLTRLQKNYNYCHSSTRMVVERSLGLLKGRFRSLLDRLPMTRTDLIPNYILACCTLHNICILQNDLLDVPLLVYNDGHNPIPPLHGPRPERQEALQKRLQIVANLPIRVEI